MFIRSAALFVLLPIAPCAAAQQKKIDFAHDIVPILKKSCASCHTNGTYKGSLSMDTREALLKSKSVIPGRSEKSELVKRITTTDKLRRMPRKAKPLPAKEIDLLKKWIDAGVPWTPGFSFKKQIYVAPLKPRRPKIPDPRPGLEHPIDRILAAYFAKNKIKAPASCDDTTFLRRLYLDVIGQLPTPDEVRAFQADAAMDKRARWANRLLAERRPFTEHWLTFWNDLLRNDYAGTGYIDGGRKQISIWLYRSIYDNKPYDQFVRELINPTPEAEGFIRGIKWRGNVNASQVRELQFSQNVSLVFFGANMKCASCHDSFVDSWKLVDAYGMAAIVTQRPLELHRCDKPTGKIAEPKFLFPEIGTIDDKAPPQKRLEQLAKLVTHPDNGRFTRTIANRIWQRFTGRGIVHPVDVMANRPWSEDLLDYLAVYLSDHQYDLKKLIAHIVTSRAYQSQPSIREKTEIGEDYQFRGPELKRLTAEQFMDAVWQLTDTAPKKPHARVGLKPYSATVPKDRRFIRASLMKSNLLMRSMGRPNREQVVTTRGDLLTTLQALDLANDQLLHTLLARGAANLLRRHPKATVDELVSVVFRNALARPPSADELKIARTFIGDKLSADGVTDLLWCMIMLPEFQLIR